jgi:hypothetical protein
MKKLRKPRDIKGAWIYMSKPEVHVQLYNWNLKDMKRLHRWLERIIEFMEQK